MLHCLLGAIPLNLENANRRLCRFSFQIECFPQLVVRSLRFIEIFLILFRIDARYDLGLLDLEFGLAQIVFCRFEFRLILRAGSRFFCLFAGNLVHQFLVFRLLIDDVAHLRLPVELDE